MKDPAERLVDELLAATSLLQAESLLFDNAGVCAWDKLWGVLLLRRDRFHADGRRAAEQAALQVVRLVEESRGTWELLAHRRGQRTRIDEVFPVAPTEPRMVLERIVLEHLDRGDLEAALVSARKTDALPCTNRDEQARIAQVRVHLADALQRVHRNREALDIMESFDADPEGPDLLPHGGPAYLAAAHLHLRRGSLCQSLGLHGRARHAFTSACQLAEPIGDDLVEALARTGLADAFSAVGRHRDAVREHRRVIDLIQTRRPDEDVALAHALNHLGEALRLAGDAAGARSCHQRALELVGGQEGWALVESAARFGLSDAALESGNREEMVENLFQGFIVTVTPDLQAIGTGLSRLASRLTQDVPETDLLISLAEIFRDGFARPKGPSSPEYRRVSLLFDRALALQHRRQGRLREAATLLSRLRQQTQEDPEQFQYHAVTADLAETLAAGSHADRQLAVDLLWQSRTALLRRLAAAADADTSVADPQSMRAAVQQHRALHHLLADLLLDHGRELRLPSARSPEELAFDIHEEIAQPGRRTGFASVRERLRGMPSAEQCTFLALFPGEDQTTVFTYVPATDALRVNRVPIGHKQLTDAVTDLHRAFDGDPHTFPPLPPLHPRRPWRRPTPFLDSLTPLVAAFLPYVRHRELLLVAGEGPMQRIPLHAAPMPDGRPLAAAHAVVRVPHPQALVTGGRPRPTTIGTRPVFCAGVAAREDPAPERFENDADLLAVPSWSVDRLTGTAADRQEVLRRLATARIAHLTCHGYFDRREPLDSGLLVSHDGKLPSKAPGQLSVRARLDHLITVREFAHYVLDLDLLTLRACATGYDEFAAGDVEDLVEALLRSGVGTVVAALWNVDETSSRRFLTDFYQHLATAPHRPVWRAFWQAQRNMLARPDYDWQAHPYHWAALSLSGDWSRL
ncbi:CHAT domain-containing protein [Streptomyces sp. NPDC014724]|uniref:CHAT domain-containing tetratricopeptide repeat protein n=1 Tax=unclassified Streptomyces TaxID=2593676 RepID=UPI0037016013